MTAPCKIENLASISISLSVPATATFYTEAARRSFASASASLITIDTLLDAFDTTLERAFNEYSPAYQPAFGLTFRGYHCNETHLVTASDERSTRDMKEVHILCHLLPSFRLGWLDVTIDLHVPFGWSHVLPEGHYIHVGGTQRCGSK